MMAGGAAVPGLRHFRVQAVSEGHRLVEVHAALVELIEHDDVGDIGRHRGGPGARRRPGRLGAQGDHPYHQGQGGGLYGTTTALPPALASFSAAEGAELGGVDLQRLGRRAVAQDLDAVVLLPLTRPLARIAASWTTAPASNFASSVRD